MFEVVMQTLLFAFFGLLLIIVAMSVGVLMGRKPISGSCGGVGAALGEKDYTCDICGGDPKKCDEQQELEKQANDLSYDASKKD
ncbi:MAG: (Na+)-NQR maturation NqrM [Candidatus Pelagadaptatus aseana]